MPKIRLDARMRAYVRRRTRPTEADTTHGELNITPLLDVVVNLMLFLLAASTSILSISEVGAQLPTYGSGDRQALSLSVMLTDRGIIVSDAEHRYAAGCSAGANGTETTLPTLADGPTFAALRACARSIKNAHPHETEVTFSADPAVPYARLILAMDAFRADEAGALFPEALLAAGVR